MAVSCLNSVLKHLKKTPELLQEYNYIIEEQSERGIVSDIDLNAPVAVRKLHYLPHHPVIRADKDTTKVRIVYDASCKSTGPSLNDCLHSGPSLISEIPDVLVRFRYHKVALVSDIEKAFLMVQVAEPDRDVLRFLWVFGVTSSPFLLNGTVQHHIAKYATEDLQFAQDMLSSLYVDDFNGGKSNVSEAADLYRKTKSRMKDGNFNLRRWNSNSRELTELIEKEEQVDKDIPRVSEEDETYARTNLGDKSVMGTTEQKVLGLIWNHFEDHFIFEFNFLIQFARELPLSKRSVLNVIAKLYDPLGLLSPLFTTIKVIIQELCKLKVDWDEPLTDNLKSRYLDWLIDLESVESFSIERCYFHDIDGDVISVQIHGFGDSSEAAYAAVVYLRIETTTSVCVKLVLSKARVAPLARQTIPRLELLPALILVRLVYRVQAALEPIINVDDIFCWTDSMTTLCWIQGVDKEFKQFVENRVKEIRNKVSPEHWNHCPGKDNPADIPSRGSRADVLK